MEESYRDVRILPKCLCKLLVLLVDREDVVSVLAFLNKRCHHVETLTSSDLVCDPRREICKLFGVDSFGVDMFASGRALGERTHIMLPKKRQCK